MNNVRLEKENTALLVIDIQERLAAAMPPDEFERMRDRSQLAIRGAQVLGLPIVCTEQYPKGLGPTVASLRDLLNPFSPIEKVRFSAVCANVLSQLAGRQKILVVGMETHVCVFQTVRDLIGENMTPFVCEDAVLSRKASDHRIGLNLCRQAGAVITSVETALFDVLGQAQTPEFKAISALVK